MFTPNLKPGDIINNKELFFLFKVNPPQGMRRSREKII